MFVALYEKGYIYRDRYMVNWDPGSRSAISDQEVEDQRRRDKLYYIDYPLALGRLGHGRDGAARDDARPHGRRRQPGRRPLPPANCEEATLPLVGRRLQIIADEYVKPEFGTGALKITRATPQRLRDRRRHRLEQISVIGEDGRITDPAPERFAGMTVEEAREAVVAELRSMARSRGPRSTRRGSVLAALRRADRAADLAAVVHADGRARRACDRGGHERAGEVPPRAVDARVPGLDGEHPAVVHLAPAVVGPSDPGLVSRRGE